MSMLNLPKWKIFLFIAICFWGVFQAIPNFAPQKVLDSEIFKNSKTMKLGLDLQGGSQLLLQVDFAHYLKDNLELLLDDVRKNLRKEKILYSNIQIKKDEKTIYKINFKLKDEKKFETAKKVINSVSSDFQVEFNGDKVSISYGEINLKKLEKSVLEKSIEIVRRRVDETGTREPTIQMQGADKILLQVPGLQNPDELKKLLGKTAKMTFHLMNETDPYAISSKRVKFGEKLVEDNKKSSEQKYKIKQKVELSGDMLIDSQPSFDNGQVVVSFRFNGVGAKKFAKVTSDNVGKPFAIVLDGKVITAPRINGAILGGSGIISGNFSTKEASELSLLLRSGALPAPLEVIEERSVGPSLGADSIKSGTKAAFLGFIFICILMVVCYRLFGVFSLIALILGLTLIVAVLSLFEATLTMPGIAGLVLTMGMAVDANVLIFERIKEEVRLGKTSYSAIENGFNQAFATIMDSNCTTLIATFFLFTYGSGPIKGFAVTLSTGILCSMFSAISLTKMMVILYVKKFKPKKLPV
jgi:preprotein translocase subunit SecD